MDDADGLTLPLHSERIIVATEKILTYQKEELSKKEKTLLSLCEQWRIQIRTSKENFTEKHNRKGTGYNGRHH